MLSLRSHGKLLSSHAWPGMGLCTWIRTENMEKKHELWTLGEVSHSAPGFMPLLKFSHLRGLNEHNNTVSLHLEKDVSKFLEGKASLLPCDWRDWKAWGTCAECWDLYARQSPPCPCASTAGITHFCHLSKGGCKIYKKKQTSWTRELIPSERYYLNSSGESFTYSR